jgi:hypothetical protein
MIAELANTISSQDKKSRSPHTKGWSFLRPLKEENLINLYNRGKCWRQRTFAMNPKMRTYFGPLPFREGVALDEPRRSPRVPQFACNFVIYQWIWRREPASDILLQFVTCQTISVISASNREIRKIERLLTFRLVHVAHDVVHDF